MELHKRILSSMEQHGRMPYASLRKLYSHESEKEIKKAIEGLVKEGWLRVNKSFVHEGIKIDEPCVLRTRKQMYSQPDLFDVATQ